MRVRVRGDRGWGGGGGSTRCLVLDLAFPLGMAPDLGGSEGAVPSAASTDLMSPPV